MLFKKALEEGKEDKVLYLLWEEGLIKQIYDKRNTFGMLMKYIFDSKSE